LSLRSLMARGIRRCVGPIVPAHRRLAFNYRLARLNGCEPELAMLHRLGPNRGVAIDAGANEGLYTYRLAQLYSQVHAFEINPHLADRLRTLAPPNVNVHSDGLSSKECASTLLTPIYHGRPLYGWASLESGNCPVAERYDESKVTVKPLDSFDFRDVTLLKTDVEGHETELLTGAVHTIHRNRPVVLIEVKSENLTTVRTFFARLQYVERTLAAMTGVTGAEGNYIFVPG
jgi:FkbM family methyltransferase